ncbi:LLM class flavin-dependent oxidoreductase [Deinococcus marmoris]|uniref:LLM class flavin-dependent oxidoreductase n=1 Tax=Deinococcus marmoris TaxID=249408 RepID=UPI000AEEE821|nr:LLM class flavin-dependent oxidoreductase [Deinococcus marmoris]
MQIGIDSFAAVVSDPHTGETLGAADRLNNLLEEIETADRAGIDVFGIGEHHRPEYLDSAPALILAAAAARTQRIRLTSAVTVLSANDPVRVFQEFATLDLLSRGRAELVVGRGSFVEAYPLFGLELQDYDSLFAEKLELLLRIRDQSHVHWSGQHRPALNGQGIYPRPMQEKLPIWLGVGGTPASFVRAGTIGLPLMVAIIGGDFRQFRPLIDLYRRAGQQAGFTPEQLQVGVHAFGFVGETPQAARDAFWPGHQRLFSAIGKERGWRPPTREQFDATCGPTGAYLIGDVQTVAQKALDMDRMLGGL